MKNCNKVKTVSKTNDPRLNEIFTIKVNTNKKIEQILKYFFIKIKKLPSNLKRLCHPKINTL